MRMAAGRRHDGGRVCCRWVQHRDRIALEDPDHRQHHDEQRGIGDGPGLVGRIPDPVERHPIPVAGFDMTVDAVVGGIEPTTDEPLGEGQVPLEDLVPMSLPGQSLGLFGPPRLRVGRRLGINARLRVGLGRELGRRGELPRLVEQRRQGLSTVGVRFLSHRGFPSYVGFPVSVEQGSWYPGPEASTG